MEGRIEGVTRDEILRRLEAWVDSALATEEPPRGIDAEILSALSAPGNGDNRADSYALWSAMTALTQEVKLQGRAFKELNDTLGAETNRAVEEVRAACQERERDLERDAHRRCRKEALNVLIDMRDRLARGVESARPAAPLHVGWLDRMLGRRPVPDPRVEALIKGYELTLDRLDQALADYNAREITCAGLAFDPRRMNAVDREESSAVPEGTVLEVYRSGYEWNGEVFRPAQVKVACAPQSATESGGTESV
jgi:molecular chaperone GrpE